MACRAIHQYILETSVWSAGMIKVKLVLYESLMFTAEQQFINPFCVTHNRLLNGGSLGLRMPTPLTLNPDTAVFSYRSGSEAFCHQVTVTFCDTYLLDTLSSSSVIKTTEQTHTFPHTNGTSCLIFKQISF